MQVKKQQLELDMEQQTGSKLGKECIKTVYHHPAYLTSVQNISCEMLGWMKLKLESPLSRTKIMASGPITSWQIDGETVETVTDFIFLGSKITVGSDFSHEIKKRLLLGRKTMTNLDSVLKSRDIIFLTKVHLVKAMVFPVATYGCESCTIKQAAAALVVSDSL